MKQEKNTAGTLVITGGDTARTSRYVSQAEKAAVRAAQSAAAAEAAMLHPPIPGENGNWQIWDQQAGHYADSGESCRGAEGASAYEQAVAGGYSGTEASFIEELTGFSGKAAAAEQAAADAASAANTAVESSNHADHASRQAEMFEVSAKQSAARAEAGADEARSAQAAAESARNDVETAVESVTGSAAQIQSHKQDIDELKSAVKKKAPVIIDTASGAIVSFEDGADGMPLKSLTVNIEPIQSGTGDPSPDNVRPISGWTGCNVTRTGKNRLSKDGIFQGTINADGTVNASDTTRCYTAFVKIEPGSKYTLSCETGIIVRAIHTYKRRSQTGGSWNGRILTDTNSATFTAGADDNYCRVMYCKADYNAKITPTEITSPQMENGSTATAYEEYSGDTYPITFPTEAGTVYGGTLTINADGSGKLVVDKAGYTITGNEVIIAGGGTDAAIKWVRTAGMPASTYDRNTNVLLCDQYPIVDSAVTDTSEVGIRFNPNGFIYIYNSAFTDLATAQSILNEAPVHTVLALITPVPYDLTVEQVTTLLGTNNIWADCGSVSVDYPADTKLYIQKINAPTDNDMIADTQIDSGKYFLINNSLYLSTTTIPAGDPIKPGTNCQKTNLAAALNALNT